MKLKQILLCGLMVLCCAPLGAQTSKEEMFATPEKTGGVYWAYPLDFAPQTKAPKGYKPFYISHYGRHGSRWMPKDDRYVWICKHFEDESNLTPLGLQVKGMLQRVWENAKGNGGKLSKLGALQHQGIAHRMFERYPQILLQAMR